jgi:hypothetical protein
MKTTPDLEAILQIAANAEALRPVVQQMRDVALSYGDEITSVINPVIDYIVDRKATSFKRFRDNHGLTDEQALALTLSVQEDIARYVREQAARINANKV